MAKIHPEYVVIACPAEQDAASSPSGHGFSWFRCRWACFFLTCFLTCFLTLAFVFYIAMVLSTFPAPPQVSVASASVASFGISSFPPQLSADFDVTLSLHNPSGNFHYKDVSAAITYGSTVLANASLPDFHLSKRNSTTLRVALAAAAAAEPNVAFGRMRRDRENDGGVVFRLDVWARVRYMPLVLIPRWWVSCDEITIWFPDGTGTAGSTVGPPTSCELHEWK